LGEHLREELLGDVPVRLAQSGATDALSRPTINISVDRRFFPAWATQAHLIAVEGDNEDRVDAPTSAVRVRLL
jgi:hypothetical protein